MRKTFLFPLLCALMLCSCGVTSNNSDASFPQDATVTHQTIERAGKTAVLLKENTLTNCYAATYDESGQVAWTDLSQDVPLPQGSMVLVLQENGPEAQVYVLSGDTPGSLYGTLPGDALSQKAEDLYQGNLADATGQTAYDGIRGQAEETLTGTVSILAREDGWCQVSPLAGGDDRTFWVLEDSLSFSLDATVPDRAPA